VTGGAGYIGSHTAKALAKAGFQPVVLDNLSRGHADAVKWGPLVRGDVGDISLVRETVQKYNIESVLHFAAYAYVGESVSDPGLYFSNNVVNTLSLLNALVNSGVKQFVFSSTCSTYGIPQNVPIAEDHPQQPVNPYGESKLFVERALYWHGKAHGLRSVILRYFNAAGADPENELGELHDPEPHLIPRVLHAALGKLPEVDIYGTDYSTPDGTAIRDYIHVTDLAEAHVLGLLHLRAGKQSCVLNLGTGTGHSVRDVIRTVEKVSGLNIKVQLKPPREGDPPALVARSTRAAEVLGWNPQFSDLETIVRTALCWEKARTPQAERHTVR
jgi:UDP-glucose-4-epimerase GalE